MSQGLMELILLGLFSCEVFYVGFVSVVFEGVMDLRYGLEDVDLGSMMTVLDGRVRSGDGDGWRSPRLNTEASTQRRSLRCFERLLGITTGTSYE